jgi:pimeloyl-ACP methyl ester carboxylesterase
VTIAHRIVAAIVFAAALGSPSAPERGRPVILLVHGRGLIDRDTAALRRDWFASLTSGVKKVVARSPLTDADVRLVWYEDVLDQRATAGCSYAANDPRAKRGAATDPDFTSFVAGVGNFLDMLTDLVDSTTGVAMRGLSADAAFLTDARKRCAAEQRLGDAIDLASREGRPVIVVAHSLGSLVAYDYLSARTDTGVVRRLVTIGSMAGSADLRRLLIGGDSTDTLVMPTSIDSWINVRKNSDLLALPLSIGTDVLVTADSGEVDPHEMTGYLHDASVARAVLGGWCAAFVAPAIPSECIELSKAGSP